MFYPVSKKETVNKTEGGTAKPKHAPSLAILTASLYLLSSKVASVKQFKHFRKKILLLKKNIKPFHFNSNNLITKTCHPEELQRQRKLQAKSYPD